MKKKVNTSITIDVDVFDLAKKQAKKESRNFSSMVEYAVRLYLDSCKNDGQSVKK